MEILILLSALFTKHLFLDFVYQPLYQFQNKGTYGHLGGILHAGQHILGTSIILVFFVKSWFVILALLLGEFIIHYHMDWFKMWYNKLKGYTPNTYRFWLWLGIDQYIHSLTYILIALIVF